MTRAPFPVVVAEPDGLSSDILARLRDLGPVTLGPFDRAGLIGAVKDAAVLMVRLRHMIDGEVLGNAPRLRAVVSATTGLNHIDVGLCQTRGIEIVCTRGERAFLSTITGTAELALAHLLNLARHVLPAHADVQQGRWRRDDYRGVSLRGLKLGVVGLGRLGCLMAGYGQALGMRVMACDPSPLMVPPYVELVRLEDLLRQSDAISLHATHDEGQPPILGTREFAIVRDGVLLVNTARGELVDEQAMIEALSTGRLGGVATDVLADETTWVSFRDHPLVRYAAEHANVIITPHIGGATLDGLVRAERFVVAKLLRCFDLDPAPLPR